VIPIVIRPSIAADLYAITRIYAWNTIGAAGWKFNCWLDVFLMQRGLGPGDATPAPAA